MTSITFKTSDFVELWFKTTWRRIKSKASGLSNKRNLNVDYWYENWKPIVVLLVKVWQFIDLSGFITKLLAMDKSDSS